MLNEIVHKTSVDINTKEDAMYKEDIEKGFIGNEIIKSLFINLGNSNCESNNFSFRNQIK